MSLEFGRRKSFERIDEKKSEEIDEIGILERNLENIRRRQELERLEREKKEARKKRELFEFGRNGVEGLGKEKDEGIYGAPSNSFQEESASSRETDDQMDRISRSYTRLALAELKKKLDAKIAELEREVREEEEKTKNKKEDSVKPQEKEEIKTEENHQSSQKQDKKAKSQSSNSSSVDEQPKEKEALSNNESDLGTQEHLNPLNDRGELNSSKQNVQNSQSDIKKTIVINEEEKLQDKSDEMIGSIDKKEQLSKVIETINEVADQKSKYEEVKQKYEEQSISKKLVSKIESKQSEEIDMDLDKFEKEESKILNAKHFTAEQKREMIEDLYSEFDKYTEENPEISKRK